MHFTIPKYNNFTAQSKANGFSDILQNKLGNNTYQAKGSVISKIAKDSVSKVISDQECQQVVAEAYKPTNDIAKIKDPLLRNRLINSTYYHLAEQDPNNRWINLAAYVSVQGGCAMLKLKKLKSDNGI